MTWSMGLEVCEISLTQLTETFCGFPRSEFQSMLNLAQQFDSVKKLDWIFLSELVTHFIGMIKLFVWYSNAAATIDSLNFPARNRKCVQTVFFLLSWEILEIQRWWDARAPHRAPCENFNSSEKNNSEMLFFHDTNFMGEDKGERSHFYRSLRAI